MALLDKFLKKGPIRNKDTGNFIERYKKSFFHAIDGLIYCLKEEHNMIIILVCAILVIIFGFIYNINSYEWLFIISMIGLVSICEFINSSVEAIVDLITNKYNELAKIAKDVASTATLVASITALVGALIIFIPKIF